MPIKAVSNIRPFARRLRSAPHVAAEELHGESGREPERILNLMIPFIPVKTGQLRDSRSVAEPEGVFEIRSAIVFNAPHAAHVEGRTKFGSNVIDEQRDVTARNFSEAAKRGLLKAFKG